MGLLSVPFRFHRRRGSLSLGLGLGLARRSRASLAPDQFGSVVADFRSTGNLFSDLGHTTPATADDTVLGSVQDFRGVATYTTAGNATLKTNQTTNGLPALRFTQTPSPGMKLDFAQVNVRAVLFIGRYRDNDINPIGLGSPFGSQNSDEWQGTTGVQVWNPEEFGQPAYTSNPVLDGKLFVNGKGPSQPYLMGKPSRFTCFLVTTTANVPLGTIANSHAASNSYANLDVVAVIGFSAVPSDAQGRALTNWGRAYAGIAPLPLLLMEGDSLTVGDPGVTGYSVPGRVLSSRTAALDYWDVYQAAIYGRRLDQIESEFATRCATLTDTRRSANLFTLDEWTNYFGITPGASVAGAVILASSVMAQAQAAGYTGRGLVAPSRHWDTPAIDTNLTDTRLALDSVWHTWSDALSHCYHDARFNTDKNVTFPGYYSDGQHLTAIGYDLKGEYLDTLRAALVAGTGVIRILSPATGDVLVTGGTQRIEWVSASHATAKLGGATSVSNPGNVKIELSEDGGANWSTIAASTLNDGVYDWTIAGTNSVTCRIRVSSVTVPAVLYSTGDFEITDTPPPSPLLDDLIGHWAGEDLTDSHTNGLNLTDHATVTFPAGKVANCFSFIGGPWASHADSALFDPNNTARTWAFWVKTSSAGTSRPVAAKWTYQTDSSWAIQLNAVGGGVHSVTAHIGASAGDDGGNNGVASNGISGILTGSWCHVAIVYDGTLIGNANRLKIYFNGVAQSLAFNGTIPATLRNSAAAFELGGWSSLSRVADDLIDEFSMAGRAWSAEEVALHYGGGSGAAYPFT